MEQYQISFIGAGRVASSLSGQFYDSGFRIAEIVSKTEKQGSRLAEKYDASWSKDSSFQDSTDVIIVSVPDDTLHNVLSEISCDSKTVVAHTAGSFGTEVFPAYLKHTGVFYPLQTFSFNRKVDYKNLPFFIEASDSISFDILKCLAETIGGKVYSVDTERRRLLHVAAVFVNNFTNFMLTGGKKIAEKAGLPFEILEPLINETISKAFKNGPENSQTGPAVRSDIGTIEKQTDLLSFSAEWQYVYTEVTRSIMTLYNNIKNDKF